MKKIISLAVLILAIAAQGRAQKAEIYSPDGKAIKGYDPVAFFTQSKPVKGADSLSYSWNGATWLFSSRQNLQRFKADPAKYAPQYGGYCAYGTSQGHKAPTEVDTWTIVNNKLYLNYSQKVKAEWTKDEAGYIQKADKQWPQIKDKE
ncbi:MAG: YHS domain-containing (seleno)protein [Bacteroidota bacterium]|nr:YHS domain-containing (seleno)protein [Bacteroidota bacterium]MDP4217185.1 YHS domain-containing (seleno)protein [Bacteroidota bacterium]MDP4245404.1 YHS domain-containing (seleno)protein [Bacteroidota bacterium]MDP4254208.1 YHS domain-containing (seleno)protein [Bacteroidota bacterium]MDP4259626.1 YHS domain-containing (seleno)protein [Bacteroidota bacterium]